MQIYLYQNDQQVGPFTEEAIRGMVASGAISPDDLGWHEALPEWQPLHTFISFAAAPAAPAFAPAPFAAAQASPGVVQTNVKQGAVIGGWVCFALGVGLMFLSMWSFFFYGPMFIVAFILSIVAMAQRRIVGGVGLLLTTLIVPTILGFYLFSTRTVKFAEDLSKEMEKTAVTEKESAAKEAPSDSSTASAGAGNPALDEKNGFRTFRLGAPFSEFSNVKLDSSLSIDNDEKIFTVEDSENKIGNAELSHISLVFSQDILKEVRVVTAGEANNLGLREALTTAYGEPKTKKAFMADQQVWEGEKVKLVFSVTTLSDTAIATFTNKEVNAKIDKLIKEKAKAGAAEGAKSL